MSDAENRLQEIKDQNKARARKYYAVHKEAIAERRKAKRAAEKQNAVVNELVAPKAPKAVAKAKAFKAVEEKEPVQNKDVKNVLIALKEMQVADADMNNTKQLIDILDITNFDTAFTKSTNVIKKIEEATLKHDTSRVYGINSKKGMYQTILKLITVLKLEIPQKDLVKYKTTFEEYKVASRMKAQKKATTEKVMDFDAYLELVETEYGVGSQEYLIASLYYLDGFRDDLQLKIIEDEDDGDSNKINYVVVPRNKKSKCTIILNVYKTSAKYGEVFIPVPDRLSRLIRHYVNGNGLEYGQYIFGSKPLSKYISDFNRTMGLDVTINTLRQMLVSKAMQGGLDAAGRVLLAQKLHHSPVTSEDYLHEVAPVASAPVGITTRSRTGKKK